MSETIKRIKRIIVVKRWARAKRKASEQAEQKESSERISDGDTTPSDFHIGGGIVVTVISSMIGIVMLLTVVLPVTNDVISQMKNDSLLNQSGVWDNNVQPIFALLPLFMIVALVLAFIRPLM